MHRRWSIFVTGSLMWICQNLENKCRSSSPFPNPHQTLHSLQPGGEASVSPSASWPPWLAEPIAVSCGLAGFPWSPLAVGSLLKPKRKRGQKSSPSSFLQESYHLSLQWWSIMINKKILAYSNSIKHYYNTYSTYSALLTNICTLCCNL